MPLAQHAQFAHKSNVSGLRLPPEALEPSEENIRSLMHNDYAKVRVLSGDGYSETFWGMFKTRNPHGIVLLVNNDLQYSNHHGLRDNELITVQPENILAIIKD